MGINIEKRFMPSVANVVGTDLSNYKVVSKGQFACNLMHVGRDEKIPVALQKDDEPIIVSPAYVVFEVVDTNVLLTEYLMMWFSRSEFDRNAWFYTDGDVRGGMDRDALFDMRIPVPAIEKQREIVAEYNTLQNRIETNKKLIATLEQTAQTLYRHTFIDNIDPNNLPAGWRMGTLGEYSTVKSGFAFKSDWWQTAGIPVIKIGNIDDNTIDYSACDCVDESHVDIAKKSIANEYSIVIAMTGATLGKIALVPQYSKVVLVNQRVGLFDLGANPKEKAPFLYYLLQQDFIQDEIFSVGGDSAQANVSNSDIERIKVPYPPKEIMNEFNGQCRCLLESISYHKQENQTLTQMQTLLLSKMGV
ncbi:MAG: restriction endonuclease subunit S [Fibrobacter sp.]|nr:restriction endonuclease subunit S [Fibrobacter sp.]